MKDIGEASGRGAYICKEIQSTPAYISEEDSSDDELILPSMKAIKGVNENIQKQMDERLEGLSLLNNMDASGKLKIQRGAPQYVTLNVRYIGSQILYYLV